MSKQRLEEITDAFAAGFQAGADAARRECAGIAVGYMRECAEAAPKIDDPSERSFEFGRADAADKLATTYRERVGKPVKE